MEQLDLKYLQYALAVARYGSVTQAARKLYLAQPNLSRAIAELEQSLGFALFFRTRRGMELTPQGKRFLGEAETMLNKLSALAEEYRREKSRHIRLSCVPSSVFVNTLLETARRMPEWSIQFEECTSCVDLFERVIKGASLAAFLYFGIEMKEEFSAYFAHNDLVYHPLVQSPAYGVVQRSSRLYHPETDPPTIDYQAAALMMSVKYYEPIGIRFYPERYSLPSGKEIRHGGSRASNLDMLSSMDDLVMLSSHIHSKIVARNDLVAIPIQPEIMVYEYGYVTKADASPSQEEQMLLSEIGAELRREFYEN